MAVAYDAITRFTFSNTPDPFTGTHTPVGTPRGVCVLGAVEASSDQITGITYGGVAMTRAPLGLATDTAGETGTAYGYFLGKGIPTGAQTVSVDHTAVANNKAFYCITVTADTDTILLDSNRAQENQANPQFALNSGNSSALRFFLINSGLPNVSDLTLIAGMTALLSDDAGARIVRVDRETSPSVGNTTVGYTGVSDDVAMVGLAIAEAKSFIIPRTIQRIIKRRVYR